jgi:membrane-associated protease RseP (regulator of RpoE activity)
MANADAPSASGDVPEAPRPQTTRETVTRLVALALGTTAVVAGIYALGGWAWVLVIVAVFAMIMLHELGHFVTARRAGMKATEFFIGFGPRLWSITKGETEYGIKAFPLGGYVKILGMTSAEELDPSDEPRSFVNQSTSKRVLVASAGSIVHFGIALVLAVAALAFIGYPQPSKVRIFAVASFPHGAASPAQVAGVKAGDVFLTINGTAVTNENVITLIHRSGDKPMAIVVRRDGQRVALVATPRPEETTSKAAKLGVELVALPTTYQTRGPWGALTGGSGLLWRVTTGTVAAFGHAFSPQGLSSLANQVTNSKAAQQEATSPSGTHSLPGALVLAVDAAHAGILPLLEIFIALNVSLGLLNMLPMLPLDGGHVAIALYERARTRKGKARYRADVNKLMPAVYAFMAFLLVFVVSKMYLDFTYGVPNPFG